MRGLYFTDKNGYTFKRINKKKARTAYRHNLKVLFCPVNLQPFGLWSPAMVYHRKDRAQFIADEIGADNDFTNLVNSFEYYNCNNNGVGRYTAFYIPVTSDEVGEQYNYKYLEV